MRVHFRYHECVPVLGKYPNGRNKIDLFSPRAPGHLIATPTVGLPNVDKQQFRGVCESRGLDPEECIIVDNYGSNYNVFISLMGAEIIPVGTRYSDMPILYDRKGNPYLIYPLSEKFLQWVNEKPETRRTSN